MVEHRARLDGEGVRLRDWSPADVAALPGLLDPSRSWHDTDAPYFGRMTAAGVQTEVARTAEIVAADPRTLPTPRTSLAVVTSAASRLIGRVSWYWECEATDWRRLGLVIYDESCWGHGYGTEALRLWTGYLFATTDALRLDFATYSGNPAMIALGRRLGFTEEGRFRRARRWSGGVHDSVVLGVLREEWPHLPAS
jgi:RimJ/RimL family protein N-acetyltransferase